MAVQGEIIKATVSYSAPGASIGQNIFYWQVAGGNPDDVEVLDKIDDFLTAAWAPKWAELSVISASLDTVEVDVVDNLGLLVRAIGSAVIGIAGIEVASVNPAAVAGYLLAKTVIPSVKGSKYLPFMSESVIDNGEFSPAAILELILLLAFYVDDLTLTGQASLTTGVVSKKTADFEPFLETGLINDIPAYQRRRKPNVGI